MNNLKKKILNLAYVGTSKISEFHIPALRKAGFKISSVSSRKNSINISTFAKKLNIQNIIYDWKDLLKNTNEYDAIMIAIDTKATVGVLEKIIKTKKPIMVEKPIALKSNTISRLLIKDPKNIFVAYNRRQYHSTQFAKKFIDLKPHVHANVFLPEVNHNNLYQNGCHVIDLMNYLFKNIYLKYNVPIIFGKKLFGFTSFFQTNRGDTINLISNWRSPSNFKIEIIYKDEKVEMSPIEKAYFYKGLEIIEPNKNNTIRKYTPKLISKSKEEEFEKIFKPGFYQQAKLFYDFVKTGKKDERLCTLDQSKKVIEIIEQVVPKI
jgi:predicted dehydrogenase